MRAIWLGTAAALCGTVSVAVAEGAHTCYGLNLAMTAALYHQDLVALNAYDSMIITFRNQADAAYISRGAPSLPLSKDPNEALRWNMQVRAFCRGNPDFDLEDAVIATYLGLRDINRLPSPEPTP